MSPFYASSARIKVCLTSSIPVGELSVP
uniref:Uncharacterized protein n=1 Tax=Anguilla anguilla TaxID=7936 RepID=A0A0E9R754_ANGAN